MNQREKVNLGYEFRIPRLLETVRLLQYGPRTFTELQNHSSFRFKASFLRYLSYCTDMAFIKKGERDGNYQPYQITPKGAALLEMFRASHHEIPMIL